MTALPPPVSMLEQRLRVPVGSLADEDLAAAEEALADATASVLAEAPHKADAWAIDAPPLVVVVALKAARREYRNPEGYTMETLGEHAAQTSQVSGAYLTPAEKAIVRRAASLRSGGFVGSVRTPSAYDE